MAALRMTLARRRPVPGLVHHADRAVQYAAHRYRTRLREHGMMCSMSCKGHCWENAPRENFFATLKRELLLGANYPTREAARVEVFQHIEGVYIQRKRHSALEYLTAAQAHAARQQAVLTTEQCPQERGKAAMFQMSPYCEAHRDQVVALSLRAWSPVFAGLRGAVPSHAYDAFYPSGWKVRQAADIEAFLREEQDSAIVATQGEKVIGWIGMRRHPEDRMGEVYILAVDPDHQRQGVATALIAVAETRLREAGMKIVMVETGDDPGHAPSRRTYETNGFERWPVARYFKSL